MKKCFAMVLAVVMLLTVTACSGTPNMPAGNAQPVDEAAAAQIRNALSLLVDRNYVVQEIGQGGQTPAVSFVPSGMTDADGSQFYENTDYYDASQEQYENNFAQAIATLRQYYAYDENTGKFLNFPVLTYLYNNSDTHKAVGEYLQNVFAGVGITLNLENQEWNTFLNTRKQGDFTLARNGWVADYNDPICFLDMWTSDSGNNDIQFGRGEHADISIYDLDLTPYGLDIQVENGTWAQTYDVLIGVIKSTADREKRYALMHLAEDLLMQTGCIMPLYYYTDLCMIDQSVEGFYANALGYKYFHKTTVNGSGAGISVCLASEPDSIDPALNSTVDGATLISHLFAGLAKWGQNENGELILLPDCAAELPEGVTNSDGSVTYTYTLKDDLKWSDGREVVAGDFVYAWNRAAGDDTGHGYLFEVIRGYETGNLAVYAPDDKTLTVTLNNPIGYFHELLALPAYMPVRKDVVEGNEGWATGPASYICNGAYTLTGWQHDSVITMKKNPNYYDAGSVTMEEIRFYLSDDANNMLSNFKNGTWLVIEHVPTNEIAALKRQYPQEFVIAPQIGTYYLSWNINADLSPTS